MANGPNKSFYLQQKVLNDNLRTATAYLALFSTTVDGNTAGTEITGGALPRVAVSFNAPVLATALGYPDAHYCDNSADVLFAAAPTNLNINGAVLFDAVSGGNRLWWDNPSVGYLVGTGIQFRVPAGDLVVIED